MLDITKSSIQEPDWALRCVRSNSYLIFKDTDQEQARQKYDSARTFQHYVAAELIAEAWDRLSMRQLKKANTEEDVRNVWTTCRKDSEPYKFAQRKLTRICNKIAFEATTLDKILEVMNGIVRSRRVERKIAKLFANMRASAQTMEDFQEIYYHSRHWQKELKKWAEDNWDQLSKDEVDSAETLEDLSKAYRRSYTVSVDNVTTWRNDNSVAEKHAEQKWDSVALTMLDKAESEEQFYKIFRGSRNGSEAQIEAFEKVTTFKKGFDEVKELYLNFVRDSYGNRVMSLDEKVVTLLIDLCKTTEQARGMFEDFYCMNSNTRKKLIKRFPDLVGR